MAKQLNVALGFSADTGQAKARIQDLQNQLNQLSNTMASGAGTKFTISDDLIKGSQAAAQLRVQLQEAMNVKTGNLDLGKFQQQMKQSGMSLEKYRDLLSGLGPAGTQAFSQLAQSITMAEIPLRRSSAMLDEFATTLKNTARWQISSSVLHGFMGTIQSAYGYAEDLNESLNNIRIVTSKSTDEMAKFAAQANRAAQSLSTTTTNYTDAALIYYQQGLADSQVQERTDVTIKMANVARENATEVSSYMTAIWNNFNKEGTQSVEHFADVITKLGAETAASSAEIAGGLEKFAAVADTIGLSYEYASAALTTIIDKTRQSEDVVGTALKTIFARIQGLNLGETLDDGTTLNKYSAALQAVGISIKDQAGELKDMDTILDEMGNKWGTLSNDQQVALAQTVAGVRQYTQLISLMDEYESFQGNVDIANNADGTLDKQAEIYAESWEAARDRVTAAAEKIYGALIDDEFFISLNNMLANVLKSVGGLIDGLGGIRGVLLAIGVVATRVFQKQISAGLNNALYNMKMLTEQGKASVKAERKNANDLLANEMADSVDSNGPVMADAYKNQGKLQEAYLASAEKMSEVQKSIAQSMLAQQQSLIENIRLLSEEASKKEEIAQKDRAQIIGAAAKNKDNLGTVGSGDNARKATTTDVKKQLQEIEKAAKTVGKYETAVLGISKIKFPVKGAKDYAKELEKTQRQLTLFTKSCEELESDLDFAFGEGTKQKLDNLKTALTTNDFAQIETAVDGVVASIYELGGDSETMAAKIDALFGGIKINGKDATEVARQYYAQMREVGRANGEVANASDALEEHTDRTVEGMERFGKQSATTGEKINAVAGTVTSFATGISSLIGLFEVWNNTDMSITDKMISTFTTLGFLIPMVTSALSKQNIELVSSAVSNTLDAGGKFLNTIATESLAVALNKANLAMAGLLLPILKFVAIAAVVVGAVYLITQALTADARAAERAAEIQSELTEAYNETKEAYDELMDSLQQYDDAYEALEELKEGTNEWKTAVTELNTEVLNLIEQYKDLAKYVDNSSPDGVLKISEEGIEYIKSIENDNVQKAYQRMLSSQMSTNNLLNSQADDNYIGFMYSKYDDPEYEGTEYEGTGGTVDTWVEEDEYLKAGKILQEFTTGIGFEKFSEELNKQGVTNENLIEALYENKESIEEGTSEYLRRSEQNDLNAELIMASYLANNNDTYNNADEDMQEGLENVSGDAYQEALKKAQADWDSKWDYEVHNAYAEMMGYTTKFGLNIGKATFEDKEGKKVVVDDDVQRQTLANKTALEEVGANVADYAMGLQGVVDTFGKAGSAMVRSAGDSSIDMSRLTADEAAAMLDLKDEDLTEAATALGYETGEALASAIESGYAQYEVDTKNINDDLINKYGVDPSDIENMTLETRASLVDNYETAKNEGGQRGVNALSGLLSGKSAEDQSALATALDDVDWSAGDSLTQINEALKEQGSDLQFSREEWTAYAEAMGDAKAGMAGLSEGATDLISALESGSELSDEQSAIMKELEERYGELGRAGSKYSKEYIEKLRDIREELESQAKAEKLASQNTTLNKAINMELFDENGNPIEGAIESFQDALEEICNQEYDIMLNMESDIQNDFDDIINKIDTANDMASKIGDNFIVAADDLEELNTAFPGILDGIEFLHDGTAQLSAESVQMALDESNARIQIDTDETIGNLKRDRAELQSRRDSAARMAEIALGLSQGEQLTAEKDAEMQAILKGMEVENDAAAADAEQANDIAVEQTAIDTSANMANAYSNAYAHMVEQSEEAAIAQRENLNYANGASDSLGSATIKPYVATTTVTTARASSTPDLTDTSSIDTAGWKEVYEYYSGLVSSYDGMIAATDGKIAEIMANGVQLAHVSEGVKSGKGSDGQGEETELNNEALKSLDEEIERYYVILNQLEDIEAELQEISTAKDRAFGKKKLDLMDQEIAKQNELLEKQKEYAAAVEANLKDEMQALQHWGAQFDDNNQIINYEELWQRAIDEYNEAITFYNTMSTDDENAKALKEAADARFEMFKGLFDQYAEDQDTFRDLQQEIIDKANEIYDAKLEKTEYAVQLKLDVDQRDLEFLQYLLETLENVSFSAANAIANLGMQAAKYLNQIDSNKSGIVGLLMNHGYGEEEALEIVNSGQIAGLAETLELTESEVSALDGWVDNLQSINSELRNLREEAWEQVNNEFQEYLDKMDEGMTKIENLKKLTQSYQNIVDIVGKKVLGVSNDLIDKMNQAVVKESQDLLRASKAELDAMIVARDALAETDTSGWSEEALYQWKETLSQMDEEIQSAQDQFMSSWEESLQAAADAWASSIENIIESFGEQIAGMQGSISELQAAYDRAADIDAQYLEAYDQIYQLSKLTREIENSIDDTDNIAAKQELKELLEEINEIEATGVELSQYDLEYLQKKYELKQAEIALNEARNAKSNVSMVRGEDGNYSYAYTADADAVENAEQNYEDKLYEMQKLNGDYINSLQESIIQAQQDCSDALAEIQASDYASYEEYMAACENITSYYQQKVDYYSQQMGNVIDNNKTLYEDDWTSYSEQTGYKIAADEEYITSFNETVFSVLTGFSTMEEYQQAFNDAIGSPSSGGLLGELANAYDEWHLAVDTAMELAGTSTEDFADLLDDETDRIVDESEEAADGVESMAEEMQSAFGDVVTAIWNWESEYGSAIDSAIGKNNELIASYNAMRAAMAESSGSSSSSSSSSSDSGSGNSSSGPTAGASTGAAGNATGVDGNPTVGEIVTYTGGYYYHDSYGSGPTGRRGPGKKVKITDIHNDGRPYPIHVSSTDSAYGWLKKEQLSGYDTGGYTGDWGNDSGRLALLHQKELVLNASDTENLLSIVDMVRDIASIIDLNAAAASGVYANLTNSGNVTTGSGSLEQEVTIHAEFPNATNHSEIEEAFNNLINTASQYANRNY